MAFLCMAFLYSCNNATSIDALKSEGQVSSKVHDPSTQTQAQTVIPSDTLNKYSYLLLGDFEDRRRHPKGTGCFIKINNQYYLITAGHVISNWNPYNYKPKEEPLDTFFIRLYSYYDQKPTLLPINITEARKGLKKVHIYQEPDVAVMKVNIPAGLVVHSIESMIETFPYKGTNPERIYSFGYPQISVYNFRELLNQRSAKCIFMPYYNLAANVMYQNNVLDSINYNVNIQSGPASAGYAGAPTFAAYTDGKIIFGGIIEAIDISNKKAYVIKPADVLRTLKKILPPPF